MHEKNMRDTVLKHRECIPFPYNMMVDMNGFDVVCAFVREFGGTNVYVPNLRTIFKECVDREIIYQFNGKNIRELARTYGYSERHIRRLVQNNIA